MEKAKISAYQLFTLILLFELGTAIVSLGSDAKQDAWLAVLIGMAGGFCLFFMYYGLYRYYPDIPPTEYVQRILGSVLGKIIAFLYVLYFVYMAARILRDFGEMLGVIAYPATPLFVLNALLLLVVVYTVYKGIEVLSRTSELLFVLMFLLAASGFLLIILSGNMAIANLQPVLKEGLSPVIKTAFTQTLYIPFGEFIVFTMIFPYVNEREKVKRTGLWAMGISGVALALITAVNISTLGVGLTSHSQFPLLTTMQRIELAEFLERLDIYFILFAIIGIFLKVSIHFYAAVMAASHLFHVKHPSHLAYPMGMVVLLLSTAIASNYPEHIQERLKIIPLYVLLPLQVVVPALLLIIAFFKNRKKAA
jgi:spore germination protein KB